jgi:Protein of unknown function (DUF3108).
VRKLLGVLVVTLALCFALVGCAPGKPLTISAIPWSDEEETSYIIQDQTGNTTGSGNLTITKEGESYILGQYWAIDEVKQTLSIKVASDSLKPICENQTIVTPEGEFKINTTYTDNKLKIEAETPQGPQSAEIDVPDDAYDNDEILFLFRAIPFEEGYQSTYTNIVASTAQKPKVTITIIGKEQVEAPAGLFDCWKLEFKVSRQKQHFWYSVDSPHYFVKYDNGQDIILLQEIVK